MNVCYVFGVLFLFFGFYVFPFKGMEKIKSALLISKEEKLKINWKRVRIAFAVIAYSIGIILILPAFWEFYRQYLFIWAVVLWFAGTGISSFLIAKSKFFLSDKTEGGKKQCSTKCLKGAKQQRENSSKHNGTNG